MKPIFTQDQLKASLCATYLATPIICNAVVMDMEKLHADIRSALPNDPISASHLPTPNTPYWTIDEFRLLHHHDRIFVLDLADLRLKVIQYHHDHILSGHFGQNKTIELVCRKYVWPNLHTMVKHFCSSCTTCKWSKAPRHKPYGLLKQLPIPELPWNSISIDFIEHLLEFDRHTAILVIVDHLMKQGIFIPIVDEINVPELARLFIIHVFSKHRVPAHVTCDQGSKFISHFFRSLRQALNMKIHYTSGYHPEADGQTKHLNQTP
jgi:hypothetical protein